MVWRPHNNSVVRCAFIKSPAFLWFGFHQPTVIVNVYIKSPTVMESVPKIHVRL